MFLFVFGYDGRKKTWMNGELHDKLYTQIFTYSCYNTGYRVNIILEKKERTQTGSRKVDWGKKLDKFINHPQPSQTHIPPHDFSLIKILCKRKNMVVNKKTGD